jgi:hypothetical protein
MLRPAGSPTRVQFFTPVGTALGLAGVLTVVIDAVIDWVVGLVARQD